MATDNKNQTENENPIEIKDATENEIINETEQGGVSKLATDNTHESVNENSYEFTDAIDEEAIDEIEVDTKKSSKNKKKNKKKMDPVSRVVLTISIIVFLGSGGFLLYKYVGEPLLEQWILSEYKDNYQSEDTATAKDGVWTNEDQDEDEERLENGVLASFKNILELNDEVVGWITVPNTPIDYPVTQTTNNTYYLTHNINKEYNSSGCPFVDYRNIIERDNLSRCTIIYAHHRRNGTMFAKLTSYNDIDFYKENPVFRFDTIYDRNQWVVFANFRTTISTATGVPFDYIRTDFEDDDDFTDFIADIRKRSLIDTPVDVTADDEILLLSTCSYERSNWRLVIAARKVRDDETTIDVSSATLASNPLMP